MKIDYLKWKLIQKPTSMQNIIDQIIIEYDVDPEVFRKDLLILLNDMSQNGPIKIEHP